MPRNYSSFLEQLRIKIYNCFMPRGDTSVPHSFTYKRRSDLSSKEVGQLTRTNREGHARDVFGICKSRMSDPARDSFKPVLVLPFAFMDWVGTYDSIPIMPRKIVSPERAKALERLAVILEGNPYHNAEGAATLRKLAACKDWEDEVKSFSFFMQDPEVVPTVLPTHGSEESRVLSFAKGVPPNVGKVWMIGGLWMTICVSAAQKGLCAMFLSALLSFTQSCWKVFKPQFGMVLKLFRRRKMS